MRRIGMKRKAGLMLCTLISLFALVGSSIWEGAAGVAASGDLPGTGLYIATNSFPLNTVVYVTNLENGQTTRVVTSSPLETTPGLLALLSRDAAEAIGLPGRTLGRVRMSQPPDSVAFSRFGQRRGGGRGRDGEGRGRDADSGPVAFAAFNPLDPPFDPFAGAAAMNENRIIDLPADGEAPLALIPPAPIMFQEEDITPEVYLPQEEAFILAEAELQEIPGEDANHFHDDAAPLAQDFLSEPPFVVAIAEDAFAPDVVAEEQEAPFDAEAYLLTLVPAEARPPAEDAFAPDPDYVIGGIDPALLGIPQEDYLDPAMFIDPIGEGALAWHPGLPQEEAVPQAFAPPPLFPVPLITRLQAGKYYLQIAAYSNPDAVHYELSRINRIDSNLARELVVIRGENPEHGTVYQILIGPLNLGESGALLQRFRSTTHRDAFIRSGG